MFNAFTRHLELQNINKITGLKYIFLAGEELVPELVTRFRRLNITIQLENLYGPTEGTVYASGYSLSEWKGICNIPIGKPLPNVKLYILGNDAHDKAIDFYEKALHLLPRNRPEEKIDLLFKLGETNLSFGAFADAIECFKKIVKSSKRTELRNKIALG